MLLTYCTIVRHTISLIYLLIFLIIFKILKNKINNYFTFYEILSIKKQIYMFNIFYVLCGKMYL